MKMMGSDPKSFVSFFLWDTKVMDDGMPKSLCFESFVWLKFAKLLFCPRIRFQVIARHKGVELGMKVLAVLALLVAIVVADVTTLTAEFDSPPAVARSPH